MKLESGFLKTAPNGMKNGAEGGMMGEPLAMKAVAILLHSSAIVKLAGSRFRIPLLGLWRSRSLRMKIGRSLGDSGVGGRQRARFAGSHQRDGYRPETGKGD